ncbi:MAG: hypothetical protein ACXAC7_13600 [Candidatus Hodarchaeales archaeon]|jgi:hypothetical protein
MKILDSESNSEKLKATLEIPKGELVFPKSHALVVLGIPYTIVILLVMFRSIILDIFDNNIMNVILDPAFLIFLGFTGMLIIGIYYYIIWKREYQLGTRLFIEIDHVEEIVQLKQESNSGFRDEVAIPLKDIKQIIFGRSPYGPDGWSCIFLHTENQKTALFTVNKEALDGIYEFAQLIKSHLKAQDMLPLLRLSEALLKNLSIN